MNRSGHLECYQLTLTTCGPLFIGSGRQYGKSSYLFDPRSQTVSFIREEALFRWLIDSGNIDQYEEAILSPRPMNLDYFLRKQVKIPERALEKMIRYRVSAGNVLDQTHSLKEIHGFLRDGQGQAYVPGSSLKGALRTALLVEMLLNDTSPSTLAQHLEKLKQQKPKEQKIPEDQYFNKLGLKGAKPQDAVNSMMRGISIADSAPIADSDMILSNKIDLRQDGVRKTPNVVRECVKPGMDIAFRLTLDRSILRDGLDLAALCSAISAYDKYYRRVYSARFPQPGPPRESGGPFLVLGGGSGFFSKTAIYPYLVGL